MAPAPADAVAAAIAGSPLFATYGQAVDRQSAYEMLTARVAPTAAPGAAPVTIPTGTAPVPANARRADRRRRRLAVAGPRAVQPVSGRGAGAGSGSRGPSRQPRGQTAAAGIGRPRRDAEQPRRDVVHEVARHVAGWRDGSVGVRHPQTAALSGTAVAADRRSPAGHAVERSRSTGRCFQYDHSTTVVDGRHRRTVTQ